MTLMLMLPQPPELVQDLAPSQPKASSHGVGFTVINFNTAAQTVRCVVSLLQCIEPPDWILVLDNASAQADFEHLLHNLTPGNTTRVQLYRSTVNLGFAGGSNFLVDCLLRLPTCSFVGLLNNDAVAQPVLTRALRTAFDTDAPRVGMSGGRMHRLAAPHEVDTLGITLYASLMPADRKSTTDPYLGPTGGCCMMTRSFLEDIIATTGYCFDARFFCYCEDTDLVLRANLLGYQPAYVDALVALHEGQASSGGRHNQFIAYHGLRNAMWMQWKLLPSKLMLRHAPQLLLAHLLTIIRQTISGRFSLLWVIYRDAWRQRALFRTEHHRLAHLQRFDSVALRKRVSPRFYRQGYASAVLTEWKSHWL